MKIVIAILFLSLSLSSFSQSSSVFIPIKISEENLTNSIKQATPVKIKFKKKSKTERMSASIRLQDTRTSYNSNTINHKIRITNGKGYYKRRGYTKFLGGRVYSPWVKAKFSNLRGNGKFSCSVELKPNYQFKTSAIIKFKVDNLDLYGINATSALKFFNKHHVKKNISKDLNKKLNEFNIKNEVSKVWNGLQTPVKIDSNLFLLISPDELLFKNISFKDNYMNMGIGLNFDISIGNKNDADSWRPDKKMPNLSIIKKNSQEEGRVSLKVPIKIDYTTIQNIAKNKIVGQFIMRTTKKGKVKKYAKILDVQIDKSDVLDVQLGLNVKLRKFFKGKKGFVYLDTKLDFDKKTKVFSVADFAIDANTNSWIFNNSLELLANKLAYNFIKSKLSINTEDKLSNVQNKINKELSKNIEIAPGINLSGKLNKSSLNDFAAKEDKLFIDFELSGSFKLEVRDLGL